MKKLFALMAAMILLISGFGLAETPLAESEEIMANIPQVNVDGVVYNLKDTEARNQITNLKNAISDSENQIIRSVDLKNALRYDKIEPIASIWDRLMINKLTPTDNPGLMTTNLTVWGEQYPEYFGYFDVSVNPGEIYAIEGTRGQAGYKPFILCNENSVVAYIEEDPAADQLYRNIIEIPEGVNRIIINYMKQDKSASSNGVIGTFAGFDYALPVCILDEINPETFNWGDFIIEDDTDNSHAGLITNALIVVSTQYPQYYKYYDIPVIPGETYAVEGMWYHSGFLPVMLCNNDTLLYYPTKASPASDTPYRNIITIPYGVNRLLVNGAVERNVGTVGKITGIKSSWNNKKIVWFGTSIPAGNANAGGGQTISSYPLQIGKALGATVYNEAVGSSCVRAGNHTAVSADDPLGWGGMDILQLMLSLSLSSAEKQSILDDWDSKWKNIISDTTTIDRSSSAISNYKNCSWDNKLAKYLTGGSVGQVDMYVFDHGYNDAIATSGFVDLSEEPDQPTDRSYYFGAMAFLFKKILEDNPKAEIVIIGHYNYDSDPFNRGANFSGKYCCDAQEKLSTKWGVPLIKTWEKLGISMNTISVDGSEITVLQSWFPDKLHPSSDTTGKALEHYANVLTPLIKEIGW